MEELPPEHAGRIVLSIGLEPMLTSLARLERRVRITWRRAAGAHRTRGLIPRLLRWVNESATGRARHRLRVRRGGERAPARRGDPARQVADLSWGVMQPRPGTGGTECIRSRRWFTQTGRSAYLVNIGYARRTAQWRVTGRTDPEGDRSGGRLCWLYSGVAAESALSDRKFTLARLDQVSLRWLES